MERQTVCPDGMLREMSDILHRMGVWHCLAFGTALGVWRDGKLIDNDWDIDLICLAEDLPLLDTEELKTSGWKRISVKRSPRAVGKGKIYSAETAVRCISAVKNGIRIDIDPAYISHDGADRIILKGNRHPFAASHPASWFSYPETVEHKEHSYLIPGETDRYLASNYGPDWKTPRFGRVGWAHRSCAVGEYACSSFGHGLTFGVFDMFHVGHLNLLRRASALCDRLTVCLSDDAYSESRKGKTPIVSLRDRMRIVSSCRYVSQVGIQDERFGKPDAVSKYSPDVLFVGNDWNSDDYGGSGLGIPVVYLPYTDGISSTILREKYKKV